MAMRTERRKFFIALLLAFLLLGALFFIYGWYVKRMAVPAKKPVAVCGKPTK